MCCGNVSFGPKKVRRALSIAQARTTKENARTVHLNHAGCSIPAREVQETVARYLELEYSLGGYEAAESVEGRALLATPYEALAELLNCSTDSIAILNSATRAWHQVFLGLPLWRGPSCIITAPVEYGSSYMAYLQARSRFGTEIIVVPETEEGDVDLAFLERALTERMPACKGGVVVVSLPHVPTSSGRVYDAEGVGRVVARHPGAVYLLDACQSAGQLPLDVGRLRCHFLTGTGRKFLGGPRGSGFLFVAPAVLSGAAGEGLGQPGAVDVRGGRWTAAGSWTVAAGATRYEEYEMSLAAKAGFGAACRHALEAGVDNIERRLSHLAGLLREALSRIEGVTVRDRGARLCGIVSFTVAGWSAEGVKAALAEPVWTAGGAEADVALAFAVSVSAAGSTRLDFDARGLAAVVRVSPHAHTSDSEVLALALAVAELAARAPQGRQ